MDFINECIFVFIYYKEEHSFLRISSMIIFFTRILSMIVFFILILSMIVFFILILLMIVFLLILSNIMILKIERLKVFFSSQFKVRELFLVFDNF